ncbi:MAG: multidrug effflux MFS transporter [Alphaproteobacteria bacterium]
MSRLPPSFIFAILVVVTFIQPLAIHMFIPAMPVVKAEFGINTGLAQATISLVMAVMAVATIVYGGMSDRFGRKPVLLGGLALYAIGAELCWFAGDIWMLLAGRVLQAMGTGCGVVLARAVLRDIYGQDRIVQMVAYLTAAYVLAPLLAPALGGVMIDTLGWRSLFMMNAGLGLALIGVVALLIPETHHPTTRTHGAMSMTASYVKLLCDGRFTAFAVQPGLNSGAFFALATTAAFLASEQLGTSATDYGAWFILLASGFMAGNFVSGWVGNRASIPFMTMLGCSVCFLTTSGLLAGLILLPLSLPLLFVPGALLGFGQGLCMPSAQAGAMKVDPQLAGSAAGVVTFGQFAVPAISQQTVGMLADGTWVPLIIVMLICTGAALIAAIVAARP